MNTRRTSVRPSARTHSPSDRTRLRLEPLEARLLLSAGAYGWLWNDADLEALWDTDESALEGWTVFLDTDRDGELDAGETNTTTDASGYYELGDQSPGEYVVAQVMQPGWKQTWPTEQVHTVTVSEENPWTEAYFGNAQGAVYGWAWNDADLDTVWDTAESTLQGWTIFLDTDRDGELDSGETSTTTDANGYYALGGLAPGEYAVAQVVQSGWRQTWPADTTHTVTISADDLWAEADFGDAQGTVYGWTWNDLDLDTVWDTSESALEGRTVFLDADNDGELDTGETSTTTDANGYYVLGDLTPGEYRVAQVVPSGWRQTWPADTAHTVTISTEDLWHEADLGSAQGAVYGWTWNDVDLDTVWDTSESALEGWTVFLDTDNDGELDTGETSTTTDANGYYVFGGLSFGDHTVAQVVQSGWQQTSPADAAHTATISADDPWAEADFGNAQGTVYGWAWNDADLDTVWDTGESALEGRTVFLDTDSDGELDSGETSATTDANGYYVFGGLSPGDYAVAQVVPSGWRQTWPADTAHTVTVSTVGLWQKANFGTAQGTVYGWTWDDADLDTVWDTGESAQEGRTVFLDADNDGELDTGETSTTTDANGYYVLGDLTPGDYRVAQVVPSGWRQTWPADTAHTVTLSTEDLWIEADLGSAQGAVYGWTWNDADQDTAWGTEEPALEGWTVFLDSDNDGDLDAGEMSATTDANGYYAFGGLAPGEYALAQVVQSGWQQTWPYGAAHTVTVNTEDLWQETYFGNVAALTVDVTAASVSENAGAAATTVTISRNTDTADSLVVSLSSSDTTESTVPATATIPAGQPSVTVDLAAVDDAILDGTQQVTVTASATGFASGSDTLQVTDDDTSGLIATLDSANPSTNFRDADGDDVWIYFNGAGQATVWRGVTSWDDPQDASTIVFEGTGPESTRMTISVNEAAGTVDGDGTSVDSITGDGLYSFDGPDVNLVGNTIDIEGTIHYLTVGDIADGSDIDLAGDLSSWSVLEAGRVGDVDLTFAGSLTSVTVESWDDGVIDVSHIGDLRQTDAGGEFGADLALDGQEDSGWSLKSAYIAGHVTGDTWEIPGDLGRLFSYRRRGRRRWATEGLWGDGDVAAAITVGGSAWLVDIDGQLQAPLTVGGDANSIALGQGATATGDVTLSGNLNSLVADGETFAADLKAGWIGQAYINSTNGLEGSIEVTKNDMTGDGDTDDEEDTSGDVDLLHVQHGTAAGASIDIEGDLGYQYRRWRNGRRRWYTEGFRSGGDVGGAIRVGGTAWLVEIDGQLKAGLTVGADANSIALDQGTTVDGDVTVSGSLSSLTAGGETFAGDLKAGAIGRAYINSTNGLEGSIEVTKNDMTGDGDTDDAEDTSGDVALLHVQNGTGAGASIDIEGDLGYQYRRWRNGRRRWYTEGFWSGGDVGGAISVGGTAWLVDIDGQLRAGLTVAGDANSIILDQGTTVDGDVTVSGNLSSLTAGGETFAGDLKAGAIGNAYIDSTNGLEGEIAVTKNDLTGDGDTDDDEDTTGSINRLHVANGTAAGATIDVEGDLGRQYRYRRNGRLRWATEGFWSGGDVGAAIGVDGTTWLVDIDGQLKAGLTVGGDAGTITLDWGTTSDGDVTVSGNLSSLTAGGETFAGDLKAGSIGEAHINSTNGLEGKIAVTKNDLTGDGDTDDDEDSTGSIGRLRVANGTAVGATIDVEGDLGHQYSRRRNGRRRWYTYGFESGASVLDDITVGGMAWLIDVDGDLAGASITANQLNSVTVVGSISATSSELIRSLLAESSFYVSDSTWSGTISADSPHVFGSTVTAQIG